MDGSEMVSLIKLYGLLEGILISRRRRAVLATLGKDLLQNRDRTPALSFNLEVYSTMLSRSAG